MPRRSEHEFEPVPEAEREAAARFGFVGGGGKHHQEVIDPLQPLPGGVVEQRLKRVREQRTPRKKPGSDAAAVQLYSEYLVTLNDAAGNRAEALARVLGIPLAEAAEREHELHREIVEAVPKNTSITELMRALDLGREARLVVLRKHVYSPVPAASLKALDALNDIDASAGADMTGSYESYVRNIMGGR